MQQKTGRMGWGAGNGSLGIVADSGVGALLEDQLLVFSGSQGDEKWCIFTFSLSVLLVF